VNRTCHTGMQYDISKTVNKEKVTWSLYYFEYLFKVIKGQNEEGES